MTFHAGDVVCRGCARTAAVAAAQAGMSVAYCGCTRLIYRAAELPEYRIAACCRTGICC